VVPIHIERSEWTHAVFDLGELAKRGHPSARRALRRVLEPHIIDTREPAPLRSLYAEWLADAGDPWGAEQMAALTLAGWREAEFADLRDDDHELRFVRIELLREPSSEAATWTRYHALVAAEAKPGTPLALATEILGLELGLPVRPTETNALLASAPPAHRFFVNHCLWRVLFLLEERQRGDIRLDATAGPAWMEDERWRGRLYVAFRHERWMTQWSACRLASDRRWREQHARICIHDPAIPPNGIAALLKDLSPDERAHVIDKCRWGARPDARRLAELATVLMPGDLRILATPVYEQRTLGPAEAARECTGLLAALPSALAAPTFEPLADTMSALARLVGGRPALGAACGRAFVQLARTLPQPRAALLARGLGWWHARALPARDSRTLSRIFVDRLGGTADRTTMRAVIDFVSAHHAKDILGPLTRHPDPLIALRARPALDRPTSPWAALSRRQLRAEHPVSFVAEVAQLGAQPLAVRVAVAQVDEGLGSPSRRRPLS
jgi:hypothetical protein